MAVVILIALFAFQSRRTQRVGRAFGPIMLRWFLVIAALGISGFARRPEVLAAASPHHALGFLLHSGQCSLVVRCFWQPPAVRPSTRIWDTWDVSRSAWYGIVSSALLLNYAGRIAIFLDDPTIPGNPFFRLSPGWATVPLVVLATVATIIASQAIITGSFSLTRQAMQLGWLRAYLSRRARTAVPQAPIKLCELAYRTVRGSSLGSSTPRLGKLTARGRFSWVGRAPLRLWMAAEHGQRPQCEQVIRDRAAKLITNSN